MKSKCIIVLLAFQFPLFSLFAQTETDYVISFHPEYNHSPFRLLDTFYKIKSGDSIRIETFRFYISGIEFLLNNKTVWKETESFHLIDAANENSLKLVFHIPSLISYDQVKFNLGIDSLTNVSGAMGGDLDPTRGMYWTWQNGYINLKLEGNCNLCKTRNNEFQFHLGGYQFPLSAIQIISLPAHQGNNMVVNIALDKLLEDWDFTYNNHIMSPSKEAVVFSKKAADAFSVPEK
ncbi:MAG: MbnP family protein [Bacteroidota bacterium]